MKTTKLFLALLVSIGCSVSYAAKNDVQWSYHGKNGPAHWGDLSKEFQMCKHGHSQSPLNIETQLVKKSVHGEIKTQYKASNGELVNNGHTIQVNVADGGHANFLGKDHKILQFHFHTPSEETIDGKAYPLNVHLVHKSADNKLGVIGVFFKEGSENRALKDIFANLPKSKSASALKHKFNVADLLPSSTANYSYTGSLTTPPCSEDVSFVILKTPLEMSPAQLNAFKKVFDMNARPVQKLNGRTIHSSE